MLYFIESYYIVDGPKVINGEVGRIEDDLYCQQKDTRDVIAENYKTKHPNTDEVDVIINKSKNVTFEDYFEFIKNAKILKYSILGFGVKLYTAKFFNGNRKHLSKY